MAMAEEASWRAEIAADPELAEELAKVGLLIDYFFLLIEVEVTLFSKLRNVLAYTLCTCL